MRLSTMLESCVGSVRTNLGVCSIVYVQTCANLAWRGSVGAKQEHTKASQHPRQRQGHKARRGRLLSSTSPAQLYHSGLLAVLISRPLSFSIFLFGAYMPSQ